MTVRACTHCDVKQMWEGIVFQDYDKNPGIKAGPLLAFNDSLMYIAAGHTARGRGRSLPQCHAVEGFDLLLRLGRSLKDQTSVLARLFCTLKNEEVAIEACCCRFWKAAGSEACCGPRQGTAQTDATEPGSPARAAALPTLVQVESSGKQQVKRITQSGPQEELIQEIFSAAWEQASISTACRLM